MQPTFPGQQQPQMHPQLQAQAQMQQMQAEAQMQRNITEAMALQAQAQALLSGQHLAGNPYHATAPSSPYSWPGLSSVPRPLGHTGAIGSFNAGSSMAGLGSLQPGASTNGSRGMMLEGVDDGLANLLMAWYYSGYYT